MHRGGKLLAESLGEEDEHEDASNERAGAHDEKGEGSPDGVEERYLRCDDPANPPTEAAAPHCRAPDLSREELRRVDEHNRKAGGRTELPDERERDLEPGFSNLIGPGSTMFFSHWLRWFIDCQHSYAIKNQLKTLKAP